MGEPWQDSGDEPDDGADPLTVGLHLDVQWMMRLQAVANTLDMTMADYIVLAITQRVQVDELIQKTTRESAAAVQEQLAQIMRAGVNRAIERGGNNG